MISRLCPLCSSSNEPQAAFCAVCGGVLDAAPGASTSAGTSGDGFGPLAAGTLVRDETLELVQVLGQGGFGITYLAHERQTGRRVAVKELFPFGCVRQGGHVLPSTILDGDAWEAAREGFRREGALLSNHAHPNVVQVLDVWDERGTTFLAMEFLDGQTLAQVLAECGALGTRRVRAMLEQVGGALALLHGAGMLHRDIKPDNIMLCRAPAGSLGANAANSPAASNGGVVERWVLLDFGAARAFASGKSLALTQIVTPGYAPLEQYAARARGGPPSDIYALAATAYHALTGAPPPPATERAGRDEMRAPDERNPNIPRNLSRAVVRALSLRVDERPASVAEWLVEMEAAPPKPVLSMPAPPPVTPTPSYAPVAPASSASPIPPPPTGASGALSSAPTPASSSAPGTFPTPEAPWVGNTLSRPSTAAGGFGSIGSTSSLQEVPQSFVLLGSDSPRAWYRVTVEARRIEWPKKCACCGESMVVPLDVCTPAIWWQLPYCAACREHAERGEAINSASNLAGWILGTLGLAAGLGLEQWRAAVILIAICAGVKVGAHFLLGALSAARRALSPGSHGGRCCEYAPAARFRGTRGEAFVWDFRSREFAREFCALNGGAVPVVDASTASASDASSSASPSRPRVST
jgi:serine/threonine protein kinase